MGLEKRKYNIVHEKEPFNAETPLDLLRQSFVTPSDSFFSRNHALIPQVEPENYRLLVQGLVENKLELTLEDIKSFPKMSVNATLQCAGNRREGMMSVFPIPGQTPWRAGAIGNADWAGTPLREVLLEAGIKTDTHHVAFTGLDEIKLQNDSFGYGGSIPLHKALSSEVLLAYEMNGETLPEEHGFPLRVVAPGYIGARSVKWLSEIEVREKPSENHYQSRDYKLYPPNVTPQTAEPASSGLMLGEALINTVICTPVEGELVQSGPLLIQGYATAGGGRLVERVDLSIDNGESWLQAELLEGADEPWSWTFWEAELDLPQGEHHVLARCVDSSANTQPATAREVWNFKGYANNSWHRVHIVGY